MSELRWNPILEEWVVTATHRQDRTFFPPSDYCPLCPSKPGGFPTEVPLETYAIVVFENKFPTFRPEPAPPAVASLPLMPVAPSIGVCEVLVYSSRHDVTLSDLDRLQLTRLVQVWRDRYETLGARSEIAYVFIFENKGTAIGVTLPHPHGQIYAFSYLPPKIEKELQSQAKHHQATGNCLHCDVLAEERRDGRRVVAENAHFIALIPFYARYPYEVHLYAKQHKESLLDFSSEEQEALAEMLQTIARKYDTLWGLSMPYMMVMHQKPTDGRAHPGCHFHIEFYPPLRTPQKLKYLAGCESGAGTYINDTLPEEKAAELRLTAPRLGDKG